MKLIVRLIFAFFLCKAYSVPAQSYIPYTFLRAVEQGTRTLDGLPGAHYFQNSANYRMDVKFNPRNGKLLGKADIVYFNNSNDTLRSIMMRLYQNLYKNGVARDETADPSLILDGVKITALSVNREELMRNFDHRTKTEGTQFTIFLTKFLQPNDSCSIHIEWNFIIPPSDLHRFGKYAEGTYFVAFWYPQVAVYDDLDGWDRMYHTGTHEFYNDFNNFDVNISLPAGYMAWATGIWKNPEQVLDRNILQRYEQATTSDKAVNIINWDDLAARQIFNRKGSKIFHYTAVRVPDFAFGVSDRYLWDGISVVADSASRERVFVSAAYMPGSENFDRVAEIGTSVMKQMCISSYGVPYPYPCVTVFNGEGGMEYPMIVNDGAMSSLEGTLFVTMHEIAHAWFPFLTGINETKYGWIDEGLTTFLPMETVKAMGYEYHSLETVIRQYDRQAGTEEDIPFLTPSWQTRENTYLFSSYVRSVAAFSMLERYMGRDTFRMGIRNFIRTWEYKHPTPYDLFNILKKETLRDLDWFIDQWFYQPGWADLAIGNVTLTGNTLKVEVRKVGAFAVPVILELRYKSGEKEYIELRPDVWKNENDITVTFILTDEPECIRLGNAAIPDKNRKDNYFDFTIRHSELLPAP